MNQCEICLKTYSRPYDLKQHSIMKHNLQETLATPQTAKTPPQQIMKTPPQTAKTPPPQIMKTPPPHLPPPQTEKTPPPQMTITPPQQQQQQQLQQQHQQQKQQQQQQQQQQPQGMETFIFKHPFTANVSGPRSSGKTHLVKTILEYC